MFWKTLSLQNAGFKHHEIVMPDAVCFCRTLGQDHDSLLGVSAVMAGRAGEISQGWEESRKIRRRMRVDGSLVKWPQTESNQHPVTTPALQLNSEALFVILQKLRLPAKKIRIKLLEKAAP